MRPRGLEGRYRIVLPSYRDSSNRWPLDRVRVRGNPNPTEARPGFRQTFDPLSGYIPETYFVIAPSTTGRDCGPSAA